MVPDMARRKTIGEQLRAQREASRLNQTQLAKLAGVQREMVCRYESGAEKPTLATLKKLARALSWQVALDDL